MNEETIKKSAPDQQPKDLKTRLQQRRQRRLARNRVNKVVSRPTRLMAMENEQEDKPVPNTKLLSYWRAKVTVSGRPVSRFFDIANRGDLQTIPKNIVEQLKPEEWLYNYWKRGHALFHVIRRGGGEMIPDKVFAALDERQLLQRVVNGRSLAYLMYDHKLLHRLPISKLRKISGKDLAKKVTQRIESSVSIFNPETLNENPILFSPALWAGRQNDLLDFWDNLHPDYKSDSIKELYGAAFSHAVLTSSRRKVKRMPARQSAEKRKPDIKPG